MLYKATDKLKWAAAESGLIIPADCRPKEPPKGFDFFAGCGGMSLGFHQAGIHVVGAMEWDIHAAHTYLANLAHYGQCKIHFDNDERAAKFEKYLEKEMKSHQKKYGVFGMDGLMGSGWISERPDEKGCEHFWMADIRNITGEMILKELGMERGELDIVAGGPPCQGFSTAGNQDIYDPRNSLVFEFARLITELRPKTFVFENVPGILNMTTPEGVPIMDEFCNILAHGDYTSYEAARKMLGLSSKARRGVRKTISKEEAYKDKREKKTPATKNLASTAKVSPQPALF